MGRLIRRVSILLLVAAGIALMFFLTDKLEGLVDALVDRIGPAWTLGLIGTTTVVLAMTWLRYGGTRVLRRWGVVLKTAHPEGGTPGADAGTERRPPLVGPRR